MITLHPDWFYRHVESDTWRGINNLPLLHMHGLLDGIERRIIERIGIEEYESRKHDVYELRDIEHAAGYWVIQNYITLRSLVTSREAGEIAQLIEGAA